MKNSLKKVFWPILKRFETGEDTANYKKSHRVALIAVGGLFMFLSLVSTAAAISIGGAGALIPVIIFFCAGLIATVVGSLGSNSAVSKIWGTK